MDSDTDDLDKAFDSAIDHFEEFKKLEPPLKKPTPPLIVPPKPKNNQKKLPVLNMKTSNDYDDYDDYGDDYEDDYDDYGDDYEDDYGDDYGDEKDEKDIFKETTVK